MGNQEVENPAAFPCTGEGFGSDLYTQKGMTLRDWFAGQALSGWLASYGPEGTPTDNGQLAEYVFTIADAMLAARNSPPEEGR